MEIVVDRSGSMQETMVYDGQKLNRLEVSKLVLKDFIGGGDGFEGRGADMIGLVTFAQLLSWLFKRYHDITVAVLTGFMLGSLRKVWPWKEAVEFATDRHGELVPIVENNVLPPLQVNGSFNVEIAFALLVALLGLGAVLLLDRWANRTDTTAEHVPAN